MIMGWLSVSEYMPRIPKGKYAVRVLVVTKEDGCRPYVQSAMYSKTDKLKHYKNSKLKYDFVDLDFDGEWWPLGDPVTHWMYYPDPPRD